MKRLVLVCGLAVLIGLFFVLDLGRFLTLAAVRQSLDGLRAAQTAHPVLALGTFMLAYVLMAALSLPGATVMGLAGGAIFGFWIGTIAVSFASTMGATLAFLLSRYLFRDVVRRRFGARLDPFDDGVRREGAWYLFGLRLIPVFPFFLVNLAMGLTAMPARTFYWVSQLGMLGGTMVFVNAGRELARLDSLAGILSPSLLLAFALLGLFPVVAKKVVERVRAKRGGVTRP